MELTRDGVRAERDWVAGRADVIVPLINEVRADLGSVFDVTVESVDEATYRSEVAAVFRDGDVAVNAAALVRLLRDLDVEGDYPGFVVDELLGRRLAATVAGAQPRSLLAEATFHYADLVTHGTGDDTAGADDLDAALAAGFQTRLPGWAWTADESPFSLE